VAPAFRPGPLRRRTPPLRPPLPRPGATRRDSASDHRPRDAGNDARLMPTHAERQIVPYRPDQVFDLVADVGKYPQFLPWCVPARVRSRSGDELAADLTIGFGPFRE